jgi:ribosomal protein S18 acetylase RimI-like enzyme
MLRARGGFSHSEHRRGGLGRSVLTAALNAAGRAGCYKVMLASGRDEETLRFYEKIGFKRGGKAFFEIRRM